MKKGEWADALQWIADTRGEETARRVRELMEAAGRDKAAAHPFVALHRVQAAKAREGLSPVKASLLDPCSSE